MWAEMHEDVWRFQSVWCEDMSCIESRMSSQLQLSCQSAAAAVSVGRRGWWEVWGPVRKHVAPVWSHSSPLFGLGCIFSPRFTRGNSTAHSPSPPSCCSVLSVFRWVFPANQEPTKSTCHKQPVTSNYRAGSRADSGPVITDQEEESTAVLVGNTSTGSRRTTQTHLQSFCLLIEIIIT